MPNRRETASISYPFVPEVPNREYISGVKDIRLQIQGDSVISSMSGTKVAETYLESITHVSGNIRYIFKSIYRETSVSKEFTYTTTFDVQPNQGVQGVTNLSSEDSNGYLMVDSDFIYTVGNITLGDSYEIEPARVFWFGRSIKYISFYNEYRNSDPDDRNNLPDTLLKTFTAPGEIKLRSGYNVKLSFFENSGILDIDGNVGNGLGTAPDNMWDEGTEWQPNSGGLLSINGVKPDANGDIPIISSASVNLVYSQGNIKIEVG